MTHGAISRKLTTVVATGVLIAAVGGGIAGWAYASLSAALPESEPLSLPDADSIDGLTSQGVSTTALSQASPVLEQTDLPDPGALFFDTQTAMDVIEELTSFGARGAGSEAEAKGFDAVAARLESFGYSVTRQTVPMPGGSTQNVIAERPGRTDQVIILGAHLDTKPPSPGGNDNASGCGVILSMAGTFVDLPTDATLRFVFFGAEEIYGATTEDHHLGSRHYVDSLSQAERDRIAGMFSIDMVGYGPDFHSRTMLKGPQALSDAILEYGKERGYPITFLKDPGRSGWSDHEAFERVGIPVSWIEWRDDPVYHTAQDTFAHVQKSRVEATGRLVTGYILGLTQEDLAALR